MPKDYALRKLHSKEEKIIFCGCDAISGLLMHYLLDELFGRGEYKILHHYDLRLQKEDAQISNVRVYEFCKYKHITDLPF